MKCANCGAEIKVGCIYCSVCGREAQIVSDYNLLEDDFLRDVLKEDEKKKAEGIKKNPLPAQTKENHTQKSESNQAGKKGKAKKGNRKHKKRVVFAIVAIILLIILVTVIILLVNDSRNNSYDYQMQQARNYHNDKNYREAESSVKRALELEPNNLEAKLFLAEIYVLRGDSREAVILLEEVRQEQPDSKEVYQQLIQLYEERKDYEAIRLLCEQVDDIEILELFSEYIPEIPEFDTAEGVHTEPIMVGILAEEDCKIYYTLDGTDPRQGLEYRNPIPVEPDQEVHIRALTKNSYNIYSEEVEGDFYVELLKPEVPKVTPSGGSFYNQQPITVEVPEGCKVYYTWGGTEPTTESRRYTEPIYLPEGNNILSLIVVDQYGMTSDVLKCNYIYVP